MAMEEDSELTPPPSPAAKLAAPGVGNAFELWLHQRLHELYDDVTREPIPAELLRLIQDDRNRRRG